MILIVLFASANLFANVYLTGGVEYTTLDDMKNQIGFNAGLGFNITNNLLLDYFYSSGQKDETKVTATEDYERVYSHEFHFINLRYLYPLTKYQLRLGGSAGAGMASVKYHYDNKYINGSSIDEDGDGLVYGMWFDAIYDVTQRISLFSKIGYVDTILGKPYIDSSIKGMDFKFGVAFSIWGKNRDLY